MNHPFRLLLPLSLAALLAASCAGSFVEEMEETETTGNVPVAFSAATTDSQPDAASRAGAITTTNLNSMKVYAYHTWQNTWATNRYAPNFMFNQTVSKSNGTWTYTPVKYWPNTKGDYLTFFAYAPATVPGLSVETAVNYAGFPVLKYTVPTTNAESQHTDLLLAEPLTNLQKGDAPTFKMNHVMTRVQVKAKCTQDITVTSVKLNGARQKGTINLNNNPAATNLWSDISTSTSFGYSKQTLVPANTTTHIAEYFMLPVTATELEFTFMNNGTSETKKVPLPTSPTWGQNKTIAYTLNIEVGSEVTLTAKGWDTSMGEVTGNMGQEVPSGTTYPYVLNGVVHESATKSYYVGEVKELWYNWENSKKYCKETYNSKRFPAREWRLPNRYELYNLLVKADEITGKYLTYTSSYWSATENNATSAFYAYGRATIEPRSKTDGIALVCIRDMGEITVYPTYRVKDGYNIIHLNASTTLGLMNARGSWLYYPAAVRHCDNATTGGHTDWRLPTRAECDLLINIGEKTTGSMWSSTLNAGGTVGYQYRDAWAPNYWQAYDIDGQVYCVRSY